MQKWYNGCLCAEKGDGYQDDYIGFRLMLMTDGFEIQEFLKKKMITHF
jgi:hypothetical protein